MKKTIKTAAAWLLVICICAALAGCGSSGQEENSSPESRSEASAVTPAAETPDVTEMPAATETTAAAETPAPAEDKGTPEVYGLSVIHETEFGGVYVGITIDDFNSLGFTYGDSVDVEFSTGYTLEDLPYYNGYYVDAGEPLVISYPGYDYVKVAVNYGDDMWVLAGLDEDATASIVLNEAGKYKDIEEARDIHYWDERERYDSDVIFANFRNVTTGNLYDGILYRSASPCDNQHNRASYVDTLMAEAGVNCILNLSDTEEKIQNYITKDDFNSPYFLSLYEDDDVIRLGMSMNYFSDVFTSKIVTGFTEMAHKEGPYLVHCTEGKDRTGFICMLLEALTGATYQEIVDDYMLTYDNYYKINEVNEPAKYRTIKEKNLDVMIRTVIGDDSVDIGTADLQEYAVKYLLAAGMKAEDISLLQSRLMPQLLTADPLIASAEGQPRALPSSYDPRPDGVSEIREQYWGTCWALSGISTFESYLILSGYADTDIALSAEDVLWWANCNENGYGWTNQDRNDGGYAAMTTGYLETVGARSAADIPYYGEPSDPDDVTAGVYNEGSERPENYYTAPSIYEVTDIVFLSEAQPEQIKTQILENGAVNASIHDDPEYFNEETAGYWCPVFEEGAFNHAISVVGWDDDYPKENFIEVDGALPENDGAWLIKNSYGKEYGAQGGYIYVSYEDAYIFITEEYNQLYSVAGARLPSGLKTYSHDEFGAVTSWEPESDGSATWANIYEFGEDETLAEASFVTWSEGAAYELYYAPVEDNTPVADADRWTKLGEGAVEHAGYLTVELEKMAVPAGEGAIVLTLTGSRPGIGTDENLLWYGRPFFNAKVDGNAAFLLTDGGFVPAQREKTNGERTYTQNVDICLRVRTSSCAEEPSGTAQTPETPDPSEANAIRPTASVVMEVNGNIFYPQLADNSSAEAFFEKLQEGKLQLELHDYGNFEKVGPLPWELPANDEEITTVPGDIILYQGNQITIYYDQNTWNFTRLGRIDNVTKEKLLEAFGDGETVTVSFWLEWSE